MRRRITKPATRHRRIHVRFSTLVSETYEGRGDNAMTGSRRVDFRAPVEEDIRGLDQRMINLYHHFSHGGMSGCDVVARLAGSATTAAV
jgi:hypothetical protein